MSLRVYQPPPELKQEERCMLSRGDRCAIAAVVAIILTIIGLILAHIYLNLN